MADDIKNVGTDRGGSATGDEATAGDERAGGTDAFGESDRPSIGPKGGKDSGRARGDFTNGIGGGVDGRDE